MDYYQAKEYSSEIGRQVGFALFCLIMVAMISYAQAIPPSYVWLAAGLVGLVGYCLIAVAVRTWAMARVTTVVEAEPVAVELAIVMDGVDWIKLLRYLKQSDAVLSRSAMTGAGIVSQRIYSPVDGSLSFPEQMVEIGAAMRVSNGSAPPSYVWTPKAAEIVREQVVKKFGAKKSPPPPNWFPEISV